MESKSELSAIGEFTTKEIAGLPVDVTSTNAEDYVEVMNVISQEFGGVNNLGVFCDIISIEQSSAVLSDVEELFMHVETAHDEQPYASLYNDGSSTNPYDFDFDYLLND